MLSDFFSLACVPGKMLAGELGATQGDVKVGRSAHNVAFTAIPVELARPGRRGLWAEQFASAPWL